MNAQIVLCKNVNDGDHLNKTIADLSRYMPYLKSVSVVPMGMTKYRDGLCFVEPFNKEDAKRLLTHVHMWQEKFIKEHNNHFIHAGDEWYIMAEEPFPSEENYDGYIQLENGVGMMRLLIDEFYEALDQVSGDDRKRHISCVSGALASGYIDKLMKDLNKKFPNIKIDVHCIRNEFFGESITVTGLLTGGDIIQQLKGKDLGEVLLMPINLLRSGENVLLDDVTTVDIENALQVPVDIIKSNGQDLMLKILGE